MHKCADSAFPGAVTPLPPGFDTVQGYIGELSPIRTPTPHQWTAAEWARFKGVRKYPVFVGTPAIGENGHPETEAFECLKALYQVGCPRGKVVGLDLEEAVAPSYVRGFYDVLHWAGFKVWVYGSASTVFRNPACDGYDVAEWNGVPHYTAGPHVKATQYADAKILGTNYDARVIRWWQWRHNLWV